MTTVLALGIDDSKRISDARTLVSGEVAEPYLSLAVFDDVGTSEMESGCAALTAELSLTTISVSGIATFQGQAPVIYASVVLTEELRCLHASVHRALKDFRSRPNYIPGSWVPHITLGICENHSEAEAAFSRLLPHSLRGEYTSSALLLVSLPPVSINARYELSGRT